MATTTNRRPALTNRIAAPCRSESYRELETYPPPAVYRSGQRTSNQPPPRLQRPQASTQPPFSKRARSPRNHGKGYHATGPPRDRLASAHNPSRGTPRPANSPSPNCWATLIASCLSLTQCPAPLMTLRCVRFPEKNRISRHFAALRTPFACTRLNEVKQIVRLASDESLGS